MIILVEMILTELYVRASSKEILFILNTYLVILTVLEATKHVQLLQQIQWMDVLHDLCHENHYLGNMK